jgi:3-isopropylmalate/(R)-2-methylmalate dehydratase small subunit
MSGNLQGRAYCIGGVLDVDWEISPIEDMFFVRNAAVRGVSYEDQLKRLASNCLSKVDVEFSRKIRPGDFLVGSRGVGWGHGHDHAALALKAVGVGAVICETTTVNFKRNCISHGLPLVEIPKVFSATENGDDLELNLEEGRLINHRSGLSFEFEKYPQFILQTLYAGGIYQQIRNALNRDDPPSYKN